MRSNGVGQNKETNEACAEDWIEEGFQLARVKFDMDGKVGREVLNMGTVTSVFEIHQNWD